MRRNKFNLSNSKTFTGDMGQLIPVQWYDVNPGDTVRGSTAALVRCQQLLSPVMHPCVVRIHHFYVPYRILWDDWEDFITAGATGEEAPEFPYIDFSSDLSAYESSLFDYMGIPPADYSGITLHLSALPFRAYSKIWNEYYKDKDISNTLTEVTTDGHDATTEYLNVQPICWEKDEFTTSRPWEERGDEVLVPLLGTPPVTGIGKFAQTFATTNAAVYETDGSGTVNYANAALTDPASDGRKVYIEQDPDNIGYPNIRSELALGGGFSIKDLRLASALQKYKERTAMFGAEYSEYLRYLGVNRNLDARLQKPEYIGGGRQTIQFSEVLATDGANTGDMYGHGISAMRTNNFTRFIPEHGLIMTLISVRPKTVYANGIHKSWLKKTRAEYFQPELQLIGQQEVLNIEVYSEHSTPNGVFGYRPQYDEYRAQPSGIAGEFRTTLDHWHLCRMFGSDPALNPTFVHCSPDKRIFASEATAGLLITAQNRTIARRNLIKYPGTKIL